MFKLSSYINILLIFYINRVLARGGHGHGHSHSHSHSHGHSHRNIQMRTFVGTAAIVDLYTIHKFEYSLQYSIPDKDIYKLYNISYIHSFNDSIKNYTCIYYTASNNTNINNNDIIVNINLRKYSENENLHKYCTYKYLKAYRENQNLIFLKVVIFIIICYFCMESCCSNPRIMY